MLLLRTGLNQRILSRPFLFVIFFEGENRVTQFEFLRHDQTDSQVDASWRKFAKPELAYGLAMGGQTDSQVAKSRQFHAYTVDLRSTCVDLRWVAKRREACVDLRTNLSLTKIEVITSGWPNETQVECKSKTYVDLRARLARTLRCFFPNDLFGDERIVSESYVSACNHSVEMVLC